RSPPRSPLFPYTTLFRSHNPQYRQQDVEQVAPEPMREKGQKLTGPDDDRRPDDLDHQLGQGGDLPNIVPYADYEEQRAPGKHSQHAFVQNQWGRQTRGVGQDCDEKGKIYGHPTYQ